MGLGRVTKVYKALFPQSEPFPAPLVAAQRSLSAQGHARLEGGLSPDGAWLTSRCGP